MKKIQRILAGLLIAVMLMGMMGSPLPSDISCFANCKDLEM